MNAAAWERVADLTGIATGVSVLDAGCGTGRFCAFAAGRGAAVHGIDVDAGRLEQALRRAPGADLRLGWLEDLPWPDASFDVVTGFNSFQYALDTELALAQAYRVTRPGGRIAICKWDRPRHNELFALLAEVGDRDIDLDGLPSDPVEDAIARAGLDVAIAGTMPVTIELAGDRALAAALAGADAFGAGGVPPHLLDAASPYRQADGSYRFRNRLMYRIVSVPAGRPRAAPPTR